MKLHYAEVINPRKACVLARHLGSEVAFVFVDLGKGEHRTPAFRALNPNAKVPVLEDGETVLWEADAILCHLARRAGSDMWPDDARQAEIMRWLSWNQVHFQPLGGVFYFENVIKPKFEIGTPDAAKIGEATKPYRRAARILDEHLATRDWLVGATPTIADFSLGAMVAYAEAAKLPLDESPAIIRWHDRLNTFDAWRDPFPPRSAAA